MSRNEEDTEVDPQNLPPHPALKDHSSLRAQAGHVLKGGFKGAVIGGAVGAGAGIGLGAVGTMMGATALMAIPVVGPIVGLVAGGTAAATGLLTAGATFLAVKGATIGAAVGAGTGGLVAVTSAGEADEKEQEEKVNRYEQAMARKQSMDRLKQVRRDQAAQLAAMEGRNPNRGLPRGREQDGMAVS